MLQLMEETQTRTLKQGRGPEAVVGVVVAAVAAVEIVSPGHSLKRRVCRSK